jgi:Trk K+ transport system NAD-binding subunit/nucleotide-binding universal stress UspA family protein
MKVLICGAGKVSIHLLRRLDKSWHVTLIEKSEEKLKNLLPEFQNVEKAISGDASSPVTLDDARVTDFDYVLALTENDRVNLAICEYACKQSVNRILARVNEQENQPKFQEMGVRTVLGSTMLAKSIYQYLRDPRINVMELAFGDGEIMEVDVAHHFQVIGKKASTLINDKWRLVAIFRRDKMVFPDKDTEIVSGDRLVVVARPDTFHELCTLMECGIPHFPLSYGQGLLISLVSKSDHEQIIRECMHLAHNTKVSYLSVLCDKEQADTPKMLESWAQSIDIEVETFEGDLTERLKELDVKKNFGIMVVQPFEASFFKSLAKPTLISLAHSISCPLLLARHTYPYKRILVPFNATSKAELALSLSVDLAKQLKAEIAVAVVDEPEFIRGDQDEDWAESVLRRIRELGHVHKFEFEEISRKGNPVREIATLAKDFNLMVMGSTTREKGLFSPHIGELMAQNVPCSVLIIAN